MKTKEESYQEEPTHPTGSFDTVRTFRQIKDEISKDLQGMTFEEMKAYLKRQSSKL